MFKRTLIYLFVVLFVFFSGNVFAQTIATNKSKLLTLAVQGKVAPAAPATSYSTTWDGRPKLAIGTGGINYNLRIGKNVFGWANSDRATMGVAVTGIGEGRFKTAWAHMASVGNEVRLLSGDAGGEKGVIIGKFGSYVLVHFTDDIMDKLAVGDKMQAKACGVGLKIKGYEDVYPHGISPEFLEKLNVKNINNKLEVPAVAVIPGELAGNGSGGSSLSGHWEIQTSYPPDIKKYNLDKLRFGDLVVLKDIQTDYGKGYYIGGATLGIVCSGPSDISGLGIGVTPILSTRFGKITVRIDSTANIGKYLNIALSPAEVGPYNPVTLANKIKRNKNPGYLKTNKDLLIETAVEGVVQPPSSSGYWITYDGKPKLDVGMASINYTVSMGDIAYGWANADHVEPDVTIQGRDKERPGQCAIAILACIGNEARVVSGEAAGAKGLYIGRHAGSDDLTWFPKSVLEKLALNDRILVKARGVGLQIEGFEDVRVNKLDPALLENLGLEIDGDQLVVPVVLEVPGHIMGSGIGGQGIENIDYDIQTTCPEVVEKYDLKKLKLGDLVAIKDHYDFYGRGRYVGAVTIGVVIHGWSDYAGHGPGLNPVLSAMPGRIKLKADPDANISYPLGIKKKPGN